MGGRLEFNPAMKMIFHGNDIESRLEFARQDPEVGIKSHDMRARHAPCHAVDSDYARVPDGHQWVAHATRVRPSRPEPLTFSSSITHMAIESGYHYSGPIGSLTLERTLTSIT